jgi:sulfite exporter TauE/SafE
MSNSLALGALALAFLGSAHCAAMCGGFARAGRGSAAALHGGRIASYALAGALAGAAGGAPAALVSDPALRFAAFALACAVLFATGLRLGGFAQRVRSRALAANFERMAAAAAQRIGPPATSLRRFMLGVLWGWAPCGLVYAALPLALVSGSASAGALAMAAFGLGTLPALLGAGWALARIGDRSRRWAGAMLMLLAVAALLGHAATDPLFCR